MWDKNQVTAVKAHFALNVKNVEQSIEFYKKLFGIEPSKIRTGYAKFDVVNPPLNFTLNQVLFKERGALSHLGIQVGSTEDVLKMRALWIERGIITQDEMQTACCFALQDKTWVTDPDGNEWEVFVVLQDNLAETDACACQTGNTNSEATQTNESCCAPPVLTGINRAPAAACC